VEALPELEAVAVPLLLALVLGDAVPEPVAETEGVAVVLVEADGVTVAVVLDDGADDGVALAVCDGLGDTLAEQEGAATTAMETGPKALGSSSSPSAGTAPLSFSPSFPSSLLPQQ